MTEITVTRRRALKGLVATTFSGMFLSARFAGAQPEDAAVGENREVEYGQSTLGPGIRSRRIDNNNGLRMHILEAGYKAPRRPCIVLLHGFPELAYSWRHQLLLLAEAGFHVVAPDLRGYGRTASGPVAFDDELVPYSPFNRIADVIGLARALGHEKVAAVVGHDWGAPVAQWCALARPDFFQSVVSMSNPFYGSPTLPLNTANQAASADQKVDMQKELAALPRPRKHYVWYHASRQANEDMWRAPQGVHDLLRALFHFKSADWDANKPFPLKSWSAAELAKMPTYYVMDRDKSVAATVAEGMPTPGQIASCRWMTEQDLRVYSAEYLRTGFQGGLNAYRIQTTPEYASELNALSGRKIEIPACFIGGENDWGVRQLPGAFEAMAEVCTQLMGVHLVDGAGHSIAEEKPDQVNHLLAAFLRNAKLMA